MHSSQVVPRWAFPGAFRSSLFRKFVDTSTDAMVAKRRLPLLAILNELNASKKAFLNGGPAKNALVVLHWSSLQAAAIRQQFVEEGNLPLLKHSNLQHIGRHTFSTRPVFDLSFVVLSRYLGMVQSSRIEPTRLISLDMSLVILCWWLFLVVLGRGADIHSSQIAPFQPFQLAHAIVDLLAVVLSGFSKFGMAVCMARDAVHIRLVCGSCCAAIRQSRLHNPIEVSIILAGHWTLHGLLRRARRGSESDYTHKFIPCFHTKDLLVEAPRIIAATHWLKGSHKSTRRNVSTLIWHLP